MGVKIDKNNNACTLDNKRYIRQLLVKFNITNCKEASTPMEGRLNINKNDNFNDAN